MLTALNFGIMRLVILHSFIFIGVCHAKINDCSPGSHSDNTSCNNDFIKTIQDWWLEMSIQEPLKCHIPKGWYKNSSPLLDLITGNQPVVSYPCNQGESTFGFKFNGDEIDGRLSGLGHLSIDYSSEDDSSKVCLELAPISGKEVVDVYGTFVNGTLQGNCKLVLNDGSIVISNFHNGFSDGLRREWDQHEQLQFVGFYQKGSPAGKCWRHVGTSLVYGDCSTLEMSDSKSIVIPLRSRISPLAGTFSRHISILENLQVAKLIKVSPEERSCILKVDAKLEKELEFSFDLHHDQAIPTNAYEDHPLCQLNSKISVPETLKKWFHDFDQMVLDRTDHQILMLLKPELSEVSATAEKVVDSVDIHSATSGEGYIKAKIFGVERGNVRLRGASFNGDGRLHGFVDLSVEETSDVTFGFNFTNLVRLQGNFEHGRLNGIVQVELQDFRKVLLTFKDGVAHGPAIVVGIAPILPTRLERPPQEVARSTDSDEIAFVGRFKNGKPHESFWIKMIGGGFMHGKFSDGEATGSDLAFIYPDFETAFQGSFKNFVMKKASEAEVVSLQCNEDGTIKVSKFDLKSDPVFYYEPPTNETFGAGPRGVIDPYEEKWITVADSSIPNSGQGVFAKKDIPAKRCLSLYSGLMFNAGQQSLLRSKACDYNRTRSMEERRHCSKYTLALTWFKTVISIPPELDTPDVFHPTLGPKVNHHFLRNNSAYTDFEHPRWGSIMCIQSQVPIQKGDEIFTYYGYTEGAFPNDFPWYFEELNRIKADPRLAKELELNKRPRTPKIKIIASSKTKIKVTGKNEL